MNILRSFKCRICRYFCNLTILIERTPLSSIQLPNSPMPLVLSSFHRHTADKLLLLVSKIDDTSGISVSLRVKKIPQQGQVPMVSRKREDRRKLALSNRFCNATTGRKLLLATRGLAAFSNSVPLAVKIV